MNAVIDNLNFHELMENSLNSHLVLDNRNVVYANMATIELLSLNSKRDIINQSFDLFLHKDFHSICKERLKRVIEYKESVPLMEQKMIQLDGKIIDVEITATPYSHADKTLAQVIIKDITEKKEIQNRIMQTEKLSLIGELAAGIVHEIRNPLTSIRGFLQLLKNDFPKNEYADIVLTELKQIENITNELLHLSKPKQTNFRRIDIIPILQESINLFGTKTLKRNVEIFLEKCSDKIYIQGDKTQLKQVFLNLLKNAIESISDNGKIHINVIKNRDDVRISVRDNGTGIPRRLIDSIGKSFITNKPEGTGLGLMVTYNIIESHNGRIWIDSKEGKGTVFTIEIPI